MTFEGTDDPIKHLLIGGEPNRGDCKEASAWLKVESFAGFRLSPFSACAYGVKQRVGEKTVPKRTMFVAFAIGWLAILAPVGAQADPIISVGSFPLAPVPSYLPSPPAGAFYVPVEISGAANLQNWQFSLNFDGTVVQEVDPGDGSSGIYGAQFTPGDVTSQSFILGGFPFNPLGLVDTVAGSYPSLPSGPSGDGVLADILFEFLPGQDGNNPNFSITNTGVVQVPVPGPEAGSLNLLATLALLAAFFAVNRVKGRTL